MVLDYSLHFGSSGQIYAKPRIAPTTFGAAVLPFFPTEMTSGRPCYSEKQSKNWTSDIGLFSDSITSTDLDQYNDVVTAAIKRLAVL